MARLQFKDYLVVVGGILLIAVSLSLAHVNPVDSAPPGPSVTVVNTPLPVQGTVNVGNFPAPSTVSGSVSVSNFPATQVTQDVLAPGQSPAIQQFGFNVAGSAASGGTTISPPVPSGQRFIATYFSATMFSGNPAFPTTGGDCRLQVQSGAAGFTSMREFVGTIGLSNTWSASEQMFVPLNTGDSMILLCQFTGSLPASTQAEGVLGGYFVPAS